MFRKILIFGAGVVVGAAGAVLALKNYYEARTEEDVESVMSIPGVREAVRGQRANDENGEPLDIPIDGIENVTDRIAALSAPIAGRTPPKSERIAYHKIAKDAGYSAVTERSVSVSEEGFPEGIEMITATECAKVNGYGKETLEYYTGNKALVGMQEEEVDISSTISYEALKHFGDSGEANVVYIRNNLVGIDYEVIREEGDFSPI